MDKIQHTLKNLHEKYNINHGACVFVCAILAEEFEKLGLQYQVCIDADCALNEVLYKPNGISCPYLTKPKTCGVTCAKRINPYHMFIRCNGKNYNKWNVKKYEIVDYTSKQLFELYYSGKTKWNKDFDVSMLKDVKKELLNSFKTHEKIFG